MSCPECCRVKKSQGYSIVIDESKPLCYSCHQDKKGRDYYESIEFQDWFASYPSFTTLEAHTEWIKANPPPPQPVEDTSQQSSDYK